MRPAELTLASDTYPSVTVIMPVRNEAAYIKRSLTAVLNQDYLEQHMEVIVADGMSEDGTTEIIKALKARHANLKLINNHGKIVPAGLNAAISQANGEILVRVDGHCEIARDYVRRCVEHLMNDGVDGVGGPVETLGETFLARVIATAMSAPFGVGGSAFRTAKDKTMFADTIPFPAYTRRIVTLAGPFDEELVRNQDDEYNYRLRKLGAKILLAGDIRSRYYSRSSLRMLWRQQFQYGYWKVRVMQKHPRQMRLRQFVPPAFVAALLMALLMLPFSVFGKWMFALAMGAYLLANLSASILTGKKEGWRLLPVLPVAYATLHVAYGLGFLVGLARFWNRWRDRQDMTRDVKVTAPVVK